MYKVDILSNALEKGCIIFVIQLQYTHIFHFFFYLFVRSFTCTHTRGKSKKWGGCNHQIGLNYGIGPNFPLIYEFDVTFLEYLRSNKQSNHIGSLVGEQCCAFLSLRPRLNIQNHPNIYKTTAYHTKSTQTT